ncbi:MAG: CRISPR-associated endonuclease Cas2 [Magnetococcales bacterium]|nr:CRISPR-associated endonuclease Cas2 [Magnetococcales bacterium]
MYLLVAYDVATSDAGGQRRLRRVAKVCLDHGQRVQNSVFECKVDPAQFTALKQSILSIIDPSRDSIRFYNLGSEWHRRVEHYGAKPSFDIDGPLIV